MPGPVVQSHVTAHVSGSSLTLAPAYTTNIVANSVIVAVVFMGGATGLPTVSLVTDGASLVWTRRSIIQFTDSGGSGNSLEVWSAPWAAGGAASTGVSLTIDRACDISAMVVAVNTLHNINAPWDTNGALPKSADNTSTSVSTTPQVTGVSTDAATSLILACIGSSELPAASPTPPTGFTDMGGEHTTRASLNVSYKVVTSAPSSATYTGGSSLPAWAFTVDDLSGIAPPPAKHNAELLG